MDVNVDVQIDKSLAEVCKKRGIDFRKALEVLVEGNADVHDDQELLALRGELCELFDQLQLAEQCGVQGYSNGHKLLRKLQKLVRSGIDRAKEEFAVGSEILDIYVDPLTGERFDVPWIVSGYRFMKVDRGGLLRPAALLVRKFATLEAVPFDAGEEFGIYEQGDNQFSVSDVQYWLNSAAKAGEWWPKPKNSRDLGRAKMLAGYMAGCSKELLEVVTPVVVETQRYDRSGKPNGKDSELCKFFLPSACEVGRKAEEYDAANVLEYFLEKRSFCDSSGRPVDCLLRDAYPIKPGMVACATKNGKVTWLPVTYEKHCVPMCAIA